MLLGPLLGFKISGPSSITLNGPAAAQFYVKGGRGTLTWAVSSVGNNLHPTLGIILAGGTGTGSGATGSNNQIMNVSFYPSTGATGLDTKSSVLQVTDSVGRVITKTISVTSIPLDDSVVTGAGDTINAINPEVSNMQKIGRSLYFIYRNDRSSSTTASAENYKPDQIYLRRYDLDGESFDPKVLVGTGDVSNGGTTSNDYHGQPSIFRHGNDLHCLFQVGLGNEIFGMGGTGPFNSPPRHRKLPNASLVSSDWIPTLSSAPKGEPVQSTIKTDGLTDTLIQDIQGVYDSSTNTTHIIGETSSLHYLPPSWFPVGGIASSSERPKIVYSSVVFNSELIVAGDFFGVGDDTSQRIAKWDGTTWSKFAVGLNGIVRALVVFNSELYAAGDFTAASDGTELYRIAKWTGSAWTALGDGFNASVYALTVYNSKLIAGGNFTVVDGSEIDRIAQWNGSTWSAIVAGVTNGVVRALTTYSTNLVASGDFTTICGSSINRIASFNGSAWSTVGTGGANSSVYTLLPYSSGTQLLAGGNFTSIGGTAASGVAAWNGSTWTNIGGTGTTDAIVKTLATYGATAIAGGSFATLCGSSRSRIAGASWNGSTWSTWSAVGTTGTGMNSSSSVNTAIEYNSALYAGGDFYTADGSPALCMARMAGAAWQAVGNQPNSYVSAVEVFNDELYVGGNFTAIGQLSINYLAKWDGQKFASIGTAPNGAILDLYVFNNELYASGDFTTIGGITASRIAKYNGSVWSAITVDSIDGRVVEIGSYNNQLTIAGYFNQIGSVKAFRVATFNGSTWQPFPTGATAGGGVGPAGSTASIGVKSMATFNGELYVGGNFTTANSNSITTNRIAKWTGSGWTGVGSAIVGGGLGNTVNTMAVYNNELVVGGDFTAANGSNIRGIAKWTGSGWTGLSSRGFESSVKKIIPYDSDLLVTGSFTTQLENSSGLTTSTRYLRTARWNGTEWSVFGNGTNSSGIDNAVVYRGELIVGGNFSVSSGPSHLARDIGTGRQPVSQAGTPRGYYRITPSGSFDGPFFLINSRLPYPLLSAGLTGATGVFATHSGGNGFAKGHLVVGRETSGNKTIHLLWNIRNTFRQIGEQVGSKPVCNSSDSDVNYRKWNYNVYYAKSTDGGVTWSDIFGGNSTTLNSDLSTGRIGYEIKSPTGPHIVYANATASAGVGATAISTSLTNTTNDAYKNMSMTFLSGSNSGATRNITAYNGSTKVITVSPGFSNSTADRDEFSLRPVQLAYHNATEEANYATNGNSGLLAWLGDVEQYTERTLDVDSRGYPHFLVMSYRSGGLMTNAYNGNTPHVYNQTITACTSCPSTGCDVYTPIYDLKLRKWNGSQWVTKDIDTTATRNYINARPRLFIDRYDNLWIFFGNDDVLESGSPVSSELFYYLSTDGGNTWGAAAGAAPPIRKLGQSLTSNVTRVDIYFDRGTAADADYCYITAVDDVNYIQYFTKVKLTV